MSQLADTTKALKATFWKKKERRITNCGFWYQERNRQITFKDD